LKTNKSFADIKALCKSALKNNESALEKNLRKITQVSEKNNKSALQKRFEK
jgi:hypothetical protein